jgi:hypothetical protein
MSSKDLRRAIFVLIVLPVIATAQMNSNAVPLRNWPAPLYWQPTHAEQKTTANPDAFSALSADATSLLTTPAGSLVFVAMTPCRIVDTRVGSGFPSAFGPPSLVGGFSRTFPLQSSSSCPVPSIAQAYSFNVSVVPTGFLDFITIWPTGQTRPITATLTGYVATVISNAAIVPAGTGGSVDVYASQNTELVIDINGYYAPQSGMTLAQGTAATPSLAFSDDTGTGIFSSGTGTFSIATGGTGRFTVRSDGDLELPGSIRKGGALFLHNLGGVNTALGLGALQANGGTSNTAIGYQALISNTVSSSNTAIGYQALASNTTGENNIALGNRSASRIISTSNNILIGNPGLATDSNTIRIGSGAGDVLPGQTQLFLAAVRGVTTAASDAVDVVIDSNGQLGTVNSSGRFKEDIHDMGETSSGLLRLRPVTFRYKKPYADGSKPLDYGLIAEEVAEVFPDLAVKGADGQVETVQYQKLTPMLLNELQKQHTEIQRQTEQLDDQARTIRLLESRLAALEALISPKSPSITAADR